jgi:hypothetical protein
MSVHWQFFPNAMTMSDLDAMRQAVRIAAHATGASDPAELQILGLIVYQYYKRGLVDPDRLGSIAVFLSSSRTFRREIAHSAAQIRPASS